MPEFQNEEEMLYEALSKQIRMKDITDDNIEKLFVLSVENHYSSVFLLLLEHGYEPNKETVNIKTLHAVTDSAINIYMKRLD